MVRGEVWDKMFLLLFGIGVIRQILGDCFCFRKQCAGVTHPRPSREGRVEMLFSFGNEGEWRCFPSGEGTKGCVTERGAAKAEIFR